MHKPLDTGMSKVPALTLAFWLIKIAATTLGETGGDAVSMSMNLGYALATAIFFACFLVTVVAQVRAKRFHPFLYWAVIIATTTAGTTIADYADRSLGIGYVGGSLLLFTVLIALLGLWRISLGSVSVDHITSPKTELFYWVTILFSNTLGTALGDFLADASGLGYEGGALVFSAALVLVAAVYIFTRGRATTISRTWLFWTAFILTRPLGATVGDLLTKAHEHGGFNLSRFSSSAVIAFFIIFCILFTSQRTAHQLRQRDLIS
ncbi:membrane protein [Dictyobacter sp. S3.2.2.5]|uniref:Membrane protein n=1 Tax=Dictyobacter halimunensis TaxID=3026934 RepID=A0ABQ6FPC5_9CHLR|nr:membrane protein [Dictyobacter sp. S3.2.2.5]